MQNDLSVLRHTYDFMLWLFQRIEKFRRNQRYTFGARMENTMVNLLSV